jgi:hypothetical protein
VTSQALPFDPAPEDEEDYERARSILKERFAAWCATNAPRVDHDPGDTLIHFKWAFVDHELVRWRSADIDRILLELYPAKVLIEEDELGVVLEETRAFIAFLAESGWLAEGSDDPAAMAAHVDAITLSFRRNMNDSSLHSPGKSFWRAAIAEGVPMDDEKAVNAFMARYNARMAPTAPSPFGLSAIGAPSARPPRRAVPAPASLRLISGRATPPGTPPRAKQDSSKRRRRSR